MQETHEFVGVRSRPCDECKAPVWHKVHTHQAPTELSLNFQIKDRRDNRDPKVIARMLRWQSEWQIERGLPMPLHQIADFLPHMDESLLTDETPAKDVVGQTDVRPSHPHGFKQLSAFPNLGQDVNGSAR